MLFHKVFITGTDTGCGKTYFSRELMRFYKQKGLQTGAMKPIASGAEWTEQGWRNDDALILQAECSRPLAYEQINPYCFQPAIAPHIAAERAGQRIDLDHIQSIYQQISAGFDCMVVEGAGGWLVPIDAEHDFADLALRLELPVILVVGLKLGCINHALLTAAAIRQRGAQLLGWVANTIDPQMAERQANINSIAARMQAPLIARIDYDSSCQWFI